MLGLALLPLTAILSVLTFTALFTYCGLAYSLYCLQALQDLREERNVGKIANVPPLPDTSARTEPMIEQADEGAAV